MTRERVVLDTNVLVSGLLSTTSVPAHADERAVIHAQLVATTATLTELSAKLLSPRFDRYVPRERRGALLLRLALNPFRGIAIVTPAACLSRTYPPST